MIPVFDCKAELYRLIALLLIFFGVASSREAFAHMNIIGLNHFVKTSQRFVAIETSQTNLSELFSSANENMRPNVSLLDSFELGNGNRVVVFSATDYKILLSHPGLSPHQSYYFQLHPGEILSFIETNEAVSGRRILSGNGRIQGLFALSPIIHHALLQDPKNLVHAVQVVHESAQTQQGTAARSQKSTEEEVIAAQKIKSFLTNEYFSALSKTMKPSINPLEFKNFIDRFGEFRPVNLERMLADLKILSGVVPFFDSKDPNTSRLIKERGGEEGRELTRTFLMQQFEAAGATVKPWCYETGFRNGCNVLAVLKNSNAASTLVLTSHLDSVRNAGADDNASGTAALVELARLFAAQKMSINLAFIAFDQEELGLIGSSQMVQFIENEIPGTYLGNINTDMIAYDADNDGAIHVMDCSRSDSSWLAQSAIQAISSYELPLQIVDACTNRSDHASFWKNGKAAVLISENFFGGDSNSCYHKQCDQINLINQNYYENVVTLVFGTVKLISESLNSFTLENE